MNYKKAKLGYKVVRFQESGSLRPYCQHMPIYRVNNWTFPEEGAGPLTVLTTRRAACYLTKRGGTPSLKLFCCLYIPSEHDRVWHKGDAEKDGRTAADLEASNLGILLPGCTALADAVLLF